MLVGAWTNSETLEAVANLSTTILSGGSSD